MIGDHLICEHMSVSRKGTWDACQQQYKFKYHLRLAPEGPVQPYFAYGKLVHKVAEEYVAGQGQRPIGEIAKDCLSGAIEVEKGQAPPQLNAEYQKKFPEHLRHIKTLNDRIGFDGKLEWPFRIDLDPPNKHLIVGFIDRLIIRGDKYFILDYKTTKKGFWRKNANTIRNDLQLRAYGRVVQREFGAKAENIRAALHYLEGGELVATRFSQESLDSAEEELHNTYKHITSTHPDDVYGRVGDQCKRCEWRRKCPFYSLT